MIYIHQW